MTKAYEVPRERVLGNFRKTGLKKPKHANSKWSDDREGMSDDHLVMIRQLPCCHCLRTPAGEAHHLKEGTKERGMSVRSTDRWSVPLCRLHHDEIERVGTRNETAWFLKIGIDPIELAQALWRSTGDLAKMIRVLLAHRSK